MSDALEILLVEDDPDSRANVADILKLDGHCLHSASSFAEVRIAGVRSTIDLVLLDRRLPDGNAEDVLPELKALLPNADFIVMTGYADMESTIAALRLGVVDYFLKPIQPDVIRQSVARINQQKRTDRRLLSEQRFANQVLATAEAVILVLDLQGRIVRFSPYFTRITGWKLQDLQGHDWFAACILGDDHEWLREVFMRTSQSAETSGILNPVLTTDGRQRQIRWSNTTLKDDQGNIESILAIGVDVTDLIAAQNVASRSERLAAIGQTVAGLAHESRNALQRIQSSAEILQLDLPPESESREEVDSIHRAALELTNTLEEVRQFAAPIQLHRELALMPGVWRRVWRYLESARADRDAEIVEDHCGCECPVEVDVLRLEQVFRNLFENALAACEDPVRIKLHCQCDGPDGVLLDIQDNGPGLCAEQRQKLFEPFFTTKSRGTGLGMSIVQRIVDAHGGDIQIAEPDGSGARFLLRLPKFSGAMGTSCPSQKQVIHV